MRQPGVALAVVVLLACGDGGGDDSAGDAGTSEGGSSTSASSTSAGTTTTTTTTTSTSSSTSAGDSTGADDGSGTAGETDEGGAVPGHCAKIDQFPLCRAVGGMRGNICWERWDCTLESTATDAVLADADGDDVLDLIVVRAGAVEIWSGDDAGGFAEPAALALELVAGKVAVGTLDDAGRALVVADAGASAEHVAVIAVEDGSPGTVIEVEVGFVPSGATLSDLDGDGLGDLLVVGDGSEQLVVMPGVADGFGDAVGLAIGPGPHALWVGAADDGEALDVLVANADVDGGVDPDTLSAFFGVGDGTFAEPKAFVVGDAPNDLAVGDVDGDGKRDIVVASADEILLSVLLGDGSDRFDDKVAEPLTGKPIAVALADVNDDGLSDIWVAEPDQGAVELVLADDAAAFKDSWMVPIGGVASGIAVADVNDDAAPDVAVPFEGAATISLLISVSP